MMISYTRYIEDKLNINTNTIVITILFVVIILSSCSSPTESEQNSKGEIIGQVMSDFVYAVLKPDGTVWTWGHNFVGTLGNGTTIDSDIPVRVLNLNDVVAIDLIAGVGVAADRDGNIWFWEFEKRNENDEPVGLNLPVKIENLNNVSLVYADKQSIVLTKDGRYWILDSEERIPGEVLFD